MPVSPPSSSLHPSKRDAPSALLRYGVAIGSVLVSAGVAALVLPHSYSTPFLFFYAAVLASLWIGGFWPGVVATVLSSVAAHFLLLAPRGSGWLEPVNLVRTAFFAVTFVFVCYLAERRRVRVAAKLRYSEADLKRAQSLARVGNWRLDVPHDKLVWSAETYRIFGVPEDTAVTYETFLAAVHPDDRALVERHRQAAEAGAPYDYEHRIVVGGEVKWVREKAELEFDANGALSGGFGAVQDITERKHAEQALRASEERYRLLFENMSEGLAHCRMLFDEQGKPTDFIYLDVNSAFGRLTGLEDVVGKRVAEVIPGVREAHPELFEAYARVGLTGQPEKFEIEFKPLGIWLSVSVYSNQKEHFIAVFDNITERKRAEQALIRSEKLATVGRLAATVAHEINNPLSAVTNALYLLKADPTLSASARQLAEIADGEAKRVTQIAKQTLGLSRQAGQAPFRPAELLDGVLALLQRKLDQKGVKLTKQCDAAMEIVGVSSEIRQVLWNLLDNAFEAVPEQGQIAVRVTHARDWRDQRVPGARITIADNGAGIRRDALAHIFEPFFTTKTTGNGLGLWVTSEIITKHGGTIQVRSRMEGARRGTTFTLFVPAAPRQVSSETPKHDEDHVKRATG